MAVTTMVTVKTTLHCLLVVLLLSFIFTSTFAQQQWRYNDQPGYTVPSPGDPNYKTYVYNSRRYGQTVTQRPNLSPYNPYYNPAIPNPNNYNPDINRGLPPGEDPNRFRYQDVSNRFIHLK